MIGGDIREAVVTFDSKGALAATYHGHGSDFGFAGGLLGYEPEDRAILSSLEEAESRGIRIAFEIGEFGAEHPNTYRVYAWNGQGGSIRLTALSTGGGMVEISEIEGVPTRILGDSHEVVILMPGTAEMDAEVVRKRIDASLACRREWYGSGNERDRLIGMRTEERIPEKVLADWREALAPYPILQLEPVLPVPFRFGGSAPFRTAKEMLDLGRRDHLVLWELAVLYEAETGRVPKKEVFDRMERIAGIMTESVEEGLNGTRYADRILGPQSMLISQAVAERRLIPGEVVNSVISCITAMMEVKSSMGLIVAAPTAGSCGVLPGTLIGAARALALDGRAIVEALLAAGIIGVFIHTRSGFAAEVGGCQLECGAASGMTAAALVQMMHGTPGQGVDAASMALQNILGMICDPVANRVEVPCLGKNVMAGMNAIACANMALAGYDKVIPFDETLVALEQVGAILPQELRCTCRGGLSLTETSIDIERRLGDRSANVEWRGSRPC
jgi:L-serine dehydratase